MNQQTIDLIFFVVLVIALSLLVLSSGCTPPCPEGQKQTTYTYYDNDGKRQARAVCS